MPTIDARCGALRNAGEPYIIDPNPIGEPRVYDKTPSLNTQGGGNRKPLIANQHFFRTGEYGDGLFEDKVPTLETGSGRDLVLNGVRRLTPVECERLQGFPDNWTEGVSDSQRYKLLGNAVTVNVIRFLGERMTQASLLEKIVQGFEKIG